jgi:polysaccharide pyruvyl transferase CsaB
MAEILIAGYYGFHNAGDEAILAGIQRAVRPLLPGVRFTAISGTASQTRQLHGIEAVSRSDLSAIWRALGRADLLMFGGGSLLQDVSSSRSLIYYLGLVILAKLRGKPVMFYAQGIGPITRPLGRALVPLVVNRVDRITVRDPEAADALRRLGVHRPPITVTADAALALGPSNPEWGDALLREDGVDVDRPLIGVSVRPWKQGEGRMEPGLAQALDQLARDTGAEVVFIPMQRRTDAAAAHVVAGLMKAPARVLSGTYTHDQLQAIIARCSLLVGMRYHSLVFAAMNGVPLVGLSYDPKNDAFLKLVGQRAAGSTAALDPAVVADAGRRALAEADEMRSMLRERMAELARASRENAEVVAELLGRGSAMN